MSWWGHGGEQMLGEGVGNEAEVDRIGLRCPGNAENKI